MKFRNLHLIAVLSMALAMTGQTALAHDGHPCSGYTGAGTCNMASGNSCCTPLGFCTCPDLHYCTSSTGQCNFGYEPCYGETVGQLIVTTAGYSCPSLPPGARWGTCAWGCEGMPNCQNGYCTCDACGNPQQFCYSQTATPTPTPTRTPTLTPTHTKTPFVPTVTPTPTLTPTPTISSITPTPGLTMKPVLVN